MSKEALKKAAQALFGFQLNAFSRCLREDQIF